MPRGKFASTNQKYFPDLGSDASSVWNFCAHFSEVILPGNQWWRREMSFVFSGYQTAKTHAANKREEQRPFFRFLDIGRSNVKVSDLPLRETIY